MIQEIHNDLVWPTVLPSTNIVADGTTVGPLVLDREQTENYAVEVGVQSGTVTDGTFTLLLEDSDDGLAYATVDADFLVGDLPVFTAGENDTNKSVGYVGHGRFLRASLVATGVTTGGTLGITALLLSHRHQPVA